MPSRPLLWLGSVAFVLSLAASACSSRPANPDALPTISTAPIAPHQAAPTGASASDSGASSDTTPVSCEIDRVIDSLTVRHQIAQVLTVGVRTEADAAWAIDEFRVGGIFIGSDTDPAVLTSRAPVRLQNLSPLPLLVAIDEEGGRVSRLRGIEAPIPSARVMAATMTPDQVRAVGHRRAVILRSYGITVDFAPTVDVSGGPDSDVIGDRSFSPDPQRVTQYARAFARGLLQGGVRPVFKHFPGHGEASGDTHLGSASTGPLARLIDRDLVPFRELAEMPGAAVMVGHLTVPGLTEPGLPSSLSPASYALLREGEGYHSAPYPGAIFTDDLVGMKAITSRWSISEAVLASLKAGADSPLWISTHGLPNVIDRVEAAVLDGSYPRSKLHKSLRRMLVLRGMQPC